VPHPGKTRPDTKSQLKQKLPPPSPCGAAIGSITLQSFCAHRNAWPQPTSRLYGRPIFEIREYADSLLCK